jgi:integrase
MPRISEPYTIIWRNDTKKFQFTLNFAYGLDERVCAQWRRKSFQKLPKELALFWNPKTKTEAKAGVDALVAHLRKKQEEGYALRAAVADITVGEWIEKFINIETSPRTGLNAAENKPYSLNTLDGYKSYYDCHIKNDPVCKLKMSEIEEEDILEYCTRLSVKKKLLKGKDEKIGGSRVFATTVSFMRMTFNEYQKKAKKWFNPFQNIKTPKSNKRPFDALPEEEIFKLFMPGVLIETMELAVCAAMFLSGLRRGEVYALRPEDLDWNTPKIKVCQAWQRLVKKDREMGPTKGKKVRDAPFDPILQRAIKKLWEENGQHEYVFCHKDGKLIGTSWWRRHFDRWLKRAGIELGGRRIVPHSSRHSLASLLEEKKVPIRYIQDLLGHSDLQTTKIYLHSTEKTIRDIGKKISETMEKKPEEKIIEFKVS